MRALITDPASPSGVRFVADHPQPQPRPGEVLLRVLRAGICTTDLEIARGYMHFSGVLGHEFVGQVVTGPAALLNRRVVAEINCVDPASDPGDAEVRKHFRPRTVVGILGRDGAFAEYVCVPAANCHVVPDSVTDSQAVFVEPLAAAAQVLRDAPPLAGAQVAVLGPGRLGQLVARVLALQPVRLVVIGRNPAALARLATLGIATQTIQHTAAEPVFDVLVDCTGAADGLRLAMRLVRPRGVIVLKSTYAGAAQIDLSPIVIDEIRLVGSRCGPFDEAIELLRSGRVAVEEMIDAEFPLSAGAAAFAAAAAPGAMKILLNPSA